MKNIFLLLLLLSCVQSIPDQIQEDHARQARRKKESAEHSNHVSESEKIRAESEYNQNGNVIPWTKEEKEFNKKPEDFF